MVLLSFLHSSIGFLTIALFAITPIFKTKPYIESGFEHYAEKQPQLVAHVFPALKMPLNTFVNVGYVVVGLYWLYKVQRLHRFFSKPQSYCFNVFAWLSTFYGPVQLLRIYTQHRTFGILDQWYTLPIFAWFFILAYTIAYNWSSKLSLVLILLSSASYFCVFMFEKGFEFVLALHILGDIVIAVLLLRRYNSSRLINLFFCTLLACAGFVCLKLADFELLRLGNIFSIISGHFLSKICDVLQIHFSLEFFSEIILQKQKRQ